MTNDQITPDNGYFLRNWLEKPFKERKKEEEKWLENFREKIDVEYFMEKLSAWIF